MKDLSIIYQKQKNFLQIYLNYLKLIRDILNIYLYIIMIYEFLNEKMIETYKIQS